VGARAAEPQTDPDLSTENMLQAGRIHLRPFLVLKDAGYDDNIRLESEPKEGDSTASTGAGLNTVILTGDRGGVHLFQELDYVAYGHNTDLNHWNGSARARGVLLLKSLSLSLEDRYVSVQERPNQEIDERVRRENNAVTAAAQTLGTGRLAMHAFLRWEAIDYASVGNAFADTARLNRDETSLRVVGELSLLPKTTVTLEGAVERADFENDDEGRDARMRSLLPGVRFDPSAAIQGELRAGPLSLTAREGPWSDFSGLVGDAHLSARAGRTARLKAAYWRDVEFSTTDDHLYYVTTNWTAAYEQFFSRSLSSEVLYGRGLNHYPAGVTDPNVLQVVRDDHLTTYEISVRYRPNQRMTLGLSLLHQARDSTDDQRDRTRNLYSLGTTYSF